MNRLVQLREKETRRVVGLMSGTSADGVDAALVEISGSGLASRCRPVGFRTTAYPPDVRRRLLALPKAEAKEICEMNFILGGLFARAVRELLAPLGAGPGDVDLIGSHGHTAWHCDPSQGGVASTLQIGEAAVLAEATGAVVVSDFRTRDVAAGGSGAPLVPYADFLLFRKEGAVRALQNIGGIANVTVVPDRLEGVFAFDSGPGNMVMDEVARAATAGKEQFDPSGRIAATGGVDDRLLRELLEHPYLRLAPPKSTGRELFGRPFAEVLVRDFGPDRLPDLLATVTRFTARSIQMAYERYVFPRTGIDEVWVSGGGAANETLMASIRELLDPIPVRILDEVSPIPGAGKEAVAFAILANEAIHESPANIPAATGAARPVVLGKILI